jgi:hypothetical protein
MPSLIRRHRDSSLRVKKLALILGFALSTLILLLAAAGATGLAFYGAILGGGFVFSLVFAVTGWQEGLTRQKPGPTRD